MSSSNECHALLREHNYIASIQAPIRGVHYNFTTSINIECISKICTKVNPDIVLYNFCDYKNLSTILPKSKILFPWALHIIRIHHESKRVLPPALLLEIVNNCDLIICSTVCDIDYIKSICPDIPLYIVPFGIDTSVQTSNVLPSVDIVSSCNYNPVKRLDVLNTIFSKLKIY